MREAVRAADVMSRRDRAAMAGGKDLDLGFGNGVGNGGGSALRERVVGVWGSGSGCGIRRGGGGWSTRNSRVDSVLARPRLAERAR
jgi:hypothetical protein